MRDKEKGVNLWLLVLFLAVDVGFAWYGFTILTTWNLVLWQQIFVGVATFALACEAVRIILGLALTFVMALFLMHAVKRERKNGLNNVHYIDDDYEEVEDETLF